MPQWACRAGLWMLCGLLAVCLLALPEDAGWLTAALVQAPGAARSLCASAPAGETPAAALLEPDSAVQAQPTPAPTAAPAVEAAPTPAPTRPADSGTIQAQTFRHKTGQGSVSLAAGSIQNATDLPDADLAQAAAAGLPFAIDPNSTEPQVLILHTHATETYQPDNSLWFDKAFTARTDDRARNMCAVGAAMARVLNEAGIVTLHDETLHDSPSYTESYARSAETAKAYLARYPSLKIILDVHRDALGDETTRIKPLCTLEGQNTAQIMLIAGCDNGGSVSLPRWRENLAFAAAWEAQMEGSFPGLTRPVLCGYRFYNQDLTTGSLLVEVGGHGNTLEEALRAGEYAAKALAALLLP